jgi:opacity protein-like surface antigen
MKKLLLLTVLALTTSLGAFAQKGEKAVIGNIGYQTDSKHFLIGVQGKYNITNEIRIAPDFMLLFPKNHTIGLDINVNAHYVFNVDKNVSVYPLAGIAMQNSRFSHSGVTASNTNFGFNLGGGFAYDLANNSFINAELKYTFSDGDCATFTVGYGFKF